MRIRSTTLVGTYAHLARPALVGFGFGLPSMAVRESWLDTAGPTRGLLVAILSWAAEQERARLIERTKAGMVRARAEGKKVGGRKPGSRNRIRVAA
jgi:DNA invertase Pin-like site-specific DNA recombinase